MHLLFGRVIFVLVGWVSQNEGVGGAGAKVLTKEPYLVQLADK